MKFTFKRKQPMQIDVSTRGSWSSRGKVEFIIANDNELSAQNIQFDNIEEAKFMVDALKKMIEESEEFDRLDKLEGITTG